MTEYLYHVGFDIAIKALSREEAAELADQFSGIGWSAILDGVEVWGSSLIYKGEGEGE